MKNFCIIGVAGFIAKKHIKIIKEIGGNLVAACDLHDNVGFLDSFFPNCLFFKKENKFFSLVEKRKIDYVVVCTPSYLHFKHISKSIKSGANVIVEKPPVLNKKNYLNILRLEKKYKKKCHCIFQLRLDKKLIKLKKKIASSNIINKVNIKYYTKRGNWYFNTWKNNRDKSGGLITNIGIHFIDILLWIFGDFQGIKIKMKSEDLIFGNLILKKAHVYWKLSISKKVIKSEFPSKRFHRSMIVNNKIFNFNRFSDLHRANYNAILRKKKFHISEFEKTIKMIAKLK